MAATSSIEQTPTVERQNGTPAAVAARLAWASPRRPYMPAMPTGASPTGIFRVWPSVVTDKSKTETSPDGRGTVLLTTYGLTDAEFNDLQATWTAWWNARFGKSQEAGCT